MRWWCFLLFATLWFSIASAVVYRTERALVAETKLLKGESKAFTIRITDTDTGVVVNEFGLLSHRRRPRPPVHPPSAVAAPAA